MNLAEDTIIPQPPRRFANFWARLGLFLMHRTQFWAALGLLCVLTMLFALFFNIAFIYYDWAKRTEAEAFVQPINSSSAPVYVYDEKSNKTFRVANSFADDLRAKKPMPMVRIWYKEDCDYVYVSGALLKWWELLLPLLLLAYGCAVPLWKHRADYQKDLYMLQFGIVIKADLATFREVKSEGWIGATLRTYICKYQYLDAFGNSHPIDRDMRQYDTKTSEGKHLPTPPPAHLELIYALHNPKEMIVPSHADWEKLRFSADGRVWVNNWISLLLATIFWLGWLYCVGQMSDALFY